MFVFLDLKSNGLSHWHVAEWRPHWHMAEWRPKVSSKSVSNVSSMRPLSLKVFSKEVIFAKQRSLNICCDGRVVKALDLKSNGVSPRRFEPCLQRLLSILTLCAYILGRQIRVNLSWSEHTPFLGYFWKFHIIDLKHYSFSRRPSRHNLPSFQTTSLQ